MDCNRDEDKKLQNDISVEFLAIPVVEVARSQEPLPFSEPLPFEESEKVPVAIILNGHAAQMDTSTLLQNKLRE